MLQLLSPERVAIASTELDRHVEASPQEIATELPSPTQELLQSIRIGWRDVASETARNIQRLSQATVEHALEMGQQLLRMQRDLKRKEYSTFLSVLGWASAKARKLINLAKVFDGFEPSQLTGVELITLLSLTSKRYSAVVDQLREVQDITQQLVEQLIKDTRKPRIPKQDPISGWKQNRSGGARRYEVILHDESTGLSIEQQAETEAILPHKVIQEAVALRLKSKIGQEGDSAINVLQVLEQPDKQERINAIREQIEAEAQQQARNRFEIREFALKREIADLKAQLLQSASNSLGLVEKNPTITVTQDTVASEPIEELPATTIPPSNEQREAIENPTASTGREDAVALKAMETPATATIPQEHEPTEPVARATCLQLFSDEKDALASENLDEDIDVFVASLAPGHLSEHECDPTGATDCSQPEASTNLDAIPQEDEPLEPAESPKKRKPSDDSATDCQILAADWDLIQELRAAESELQKIDAKIQGLNSKWAQSGSNVVERELKHLRSAKVSQLVELIESSGLSAYYEEQQNSCRVVLDPKYASEALQQAQSWADVVLIVGSDSKQLLSALKDWTKESRQLVVQLLSTHLETDPDSFNRIDWIPEKLLNKALSSLSFTLEKIRFSDNLVDEPELEYIRGCIFVSLQKLGTRHEQWVFSVDGKSIPAFSRSEFTVEKF